MTNRENYLSIIRRTGHEFIPYEYNLCPYLLENYGARLKAFAEKNGIRQSPVVNSRGVRYSHAEQDSFRVYYDRLKDGAKIDIFGVANEPGSAAAKHMTHMCHPLAEIDELAGLEAYPYPDVIDDDAHLEQVAGIVAANLNTAGKNGGLIISPTHLLEPEVPPENIESYMLACRHYKEER